VANYYIYSGATGTGNGSSWANAYTRLAAAHDNAAAGDTLFIAHDHVETTSGSNLNISSRGSDTAITKVICVNRGGSVPPVSADRRATAQVSTIVDASLTLLGNVHYDGVIFSCGTGTGAPTLGLVSSDFGKWMRLDNCSLRLGSTGAMISIGSGGGSQIEMNNTTMSFSNVGQFAVVIAVVRWRNTANAVIGTAVPNVLFFASVGLFSDLEIIGVDLSAVTGAGKVLFGSGGTQSVAKARVIDCKLSTSTSNIAATPASPASEINCIRSGGAGVNYDLFSYNSGGSLQENTAVVRTGGASDGTTLISWLISTVGLNPAHPYECPPILIWNENVGVEVTLEIEGIKDGTGMPTNTEIWVEAEYLSDPNSPKGSIVSDGAPSVLTGGNSSQTAGTGTWSGSGTRTQFKLGVTFTPRLKGFVTAWVKIGKPNSSFYIDPKARLS